MSDEIQAPQDPANQTIAASEDKQVSAVEGSEETSTGVKVRTPEKTLAEQASDPLTHRFECRSCGFVYDPEEGVKKLRIESGTAFQQLDAFTFRCPVCRSRVGAFRDIGPRSKASELPGMTLHRSTKQLCPGPYPDRFFLSEMKNYLLYLPKQT